MDVIFSAFFRMWSWLPWVMGLGTIGWIALALFAPGLLSIISPLLRGAAEGLVEVWKVLYEGLTDILDSWKTVVTVGVILVIFANYMTFQEYSPSHQPSAAFSKPKVRSTPHDSSKKKPGGQATWGWAQ